MLEYVFAEQLLPNIISRFIIRHNQQIPERNEHTHFMWRHGVILHKNNIIALVVESEEQKKISMKVKGLERRDFLDEIRATMNNIIGEFAGNKPDMQYQIHEVGKELQWKPAKDILKNAKRDIPFIDDETEEEIPSPKVVKKYGITINNTINIINSTIGEGTNINTDSKITDNSTHITIQKCIIGMQGDLSELTTLLIQNTAEGDALANKLIREAQEISGELETLKANNITDKDSLQKSPTVSKTREFIKKLKSIPENENVHGILRAGGKGLNIINNLAEAFNNICRLWGMGGY